MNNLLTLSTSIVIALSLAGVGSAAIAAEQTPASNNQVNATVTAAQSKISLEQAIVLGNKSIKGDLVSVEFATEDTLPNGIYKIKIIEKNVIYMTLKVSYIEIKLNS